MSPSDLPDLANDAVAPTNSAAPVEMAAEPKPKRTRKKPVDGMASSEQQEKAVEASAAGTEGKPASRRVRKPKAEGLEVASPAVQVEAWAPASGSVDDAPESAPPEKNVGAIDKPPAADSANGTADSGSTDLGDQRSAEDEDDEDSPRPPQAVEPIQPIGFAQVVSGQFDADEADESLAAHKRVLPPAAESPKLHKVLAQAGMGSRLDMEAAIEAGEVQVNGQTAHVGQRVKFGDTVVFRGRSIRVRGETPKVRVIAYHKPVGEIVTYDDPQNRPTVFRKLPKLRFGKWLSVGRLDINTEGLLLFTNSGELANRLMHPRYGLVRRYAVRVLGALDEAQRQKLLEGIQLDDGLAQFSSVEPGGGEGANVWYEVTIAEGRNREVRRLFEAVGHAVSRLIRIQYGIAPLPRGLKRGMYLELSEAEVRALGETVGSVEAVADGDSRRGGRDQRTRGQQGRGGPREAQRDGQHPGRGRPERGGILRAPGSEQGGVELPPDAQFATAPHENVRQGDTQGRRDRRDRFGRNRGRDRAGDRGQSSPQSGGSYSGAQGGEVQPSSRSQGERPAGERSRRDDPDYDPYEFQPPSGITHESKMNFGKRPPRGQGAAGGAGPDPMRTSMGYIGSDGGFSKGGSGFGGGGGRRRGRR